ncbi:MAG TPA: glycosyltransferase family 39 protein [Gemmataceae bacterium]|nr:glycosyltransferase family 39 protein [Gemmataceae bacterium]
MRKLHLHSSTSLFSPLVPRSSPLAPRPSPLAPGPWPLVPRPWPLALRLLSLVVLCGFLFFYRLADRDLWSSHEGRAAQDAQSILNDQSWGLPRLFDKKVEMQKPPLYYWLVAGIAGLRGTPVDAWAVRLPAALAALGGVVAVFGFLFMRGRPVTGVVAAVILATAVHYTALARTGRIDMPLTFAVAISLFGFYLGHYGRKVGLNKGDWPSSLAPRPSSLAPRPWFLPAYTAIAVAILLKGPIGLVLPLTVAGVFLLFEREIPPPWDFKPWLRWLNELGFWWGLPLVVGLAAPWFIWANRQTEGSFFAMFFQHHNLERAFGGSLGDHKLRAHEWYLYGPYLAGYFLPWSLLLPIAGWYWWRRRKEFLDPEARFGLTWLLTVVFVLSCVGFKRPDYLLPAFPGAALFLGCVAERWYRNAQWRRRLVVGFQLVVAGCLVGWFLHLNVFLPAREPSREYHRFAAAIRRYVPPPGLVLFFRTEAHALAFHLGPEIDTFLEWENLAIWTARPGCHYIVMPEACAREWSKYVTSGRLEEVVKSTDFVGAGQRERPLVLMRTCPLFP